ncbi:MAG TPA: hypothetical protein VF613_00285 [Longimicrobium sp.]|jgi:hypothetical protein
MRRILTLAALLALTGCDRAITEPHGPLTGTWRYQATGFQQWGSKDTCSMDVVIKIRQVGNSIEGRQTADAPVICAGPDGRVTREHVAWNGVIGGEVQDGRVHLSNAGSWHSFGAVEADRVEGYLESYGAFDNGPIQAQRSGSFVMERISDEGYHGPEA